MMVLNMSTNPCTHQYGTYMFLPLEPGQAFRKRQKGFCVISQVGRNGHEISAGFFWDIHPGTLAPSCKKSDYHEVSVGEGGVVKKQGERLGAPYASHTHSFP